MTDEITFQDPFGQPIEFADEAQLEDYRVEFDTRVRDVRFEANVVTLSLTYGLLDNLDIGALIPYIWLNTSGEVEIRVRQTGTVRRSGLPDFVGSSNRKYKGKWDRDFDGLGDVVLYSKLQFLSQAGQPGPLRYKAPVDMALQVEVKLPTGDDDEFLGTGETDVALRMLVQRSMMQDKLALRGEAGYNYSGLGGDFNSFDLKAGVDYRPLARLNLGAEVISSYSEAFHEVLDFVAGAKYSVTSDMKVFSGLRVPLNDNGLRYSASPIVGFEYTFSRPNLWPRRSSAEDAPAEKTEINEKDQPLPSPPLNPDNK